MEYVKAFNGLSKLAKFLLTLFLDPIIAGIYRLIKGRYLIGAIWIFTLGEQGRTEGGVPANGRCARGGSPRDPRVDRLRRRVTGVPER